MIPFPNKKYKIIYADPPWNGLGYNNGSGLRCPARHYEVQDTDWICNLPVATMCDTDCALLLWVTFPNLPDGLKVMAAWGFKYATCAFTWIKQNKVADTLFIGCGNYTRANAEICLLGTKGNMQRLVKSHSVRQVCVSKLQYHSKKPDEIRDRIVQLFGDIPRIELFARQKVEGWDCWGDEV